VRWLGAIGLVPGLSCGSLSTCKLDTSVSTELPWRSLFDGRERLILRVGSSNGRPRTGHAAQEEISFAEPYNKTDTTQEAAWEITVKCQASSGWYSLVDFRVRSVVSLGRLRHVDVDVLQGTPRPRGTSKHQQQSLRPSYSISQPQLHHGPSNILRTFQTLQQCLTLKVDLPI
jgi:hypothetical protein